MVKVSMKLLGVLAFASIVKGAQIHSCTVDNTVALTFDDGPTKYTSELIEKLNKYNIKATFFINAHNYYPFADENKEVQDVIKKAYQSGHQIASHTYYHSLESDTSAMKKSFAKMDSFVKSVIGVTPRYFRAPGGNCGSSCVQAIENMGYRIIKWDVDTTDWDTNAAGSISILKSFFNKGEKNYLVLMHDSMQHSVEETVPWIINSGMLKKYKFVTVAECLGEKSKMYKESSSSSGTTKSSTTTTKKTVTSTVTITKTNSNTANTNIPNVVAIPSPTTTTARATVTTTRTSVIKTTPTVTKTSGVVTNSAVVNTPVVTATTPAVVGTPVYTTTAVLAPVTTLNNIATPLASNSLNVNSENVGSGSLPNSSLSWTVLIITTLLSLFYML